MMRNDSLLRAKTEKVKDHDSTSTTRSVQTVREGPESNLNLLRRTVQRAACDGCAPSVEGIAAELAGMPTHQRASALLGMQQTLGNRRVGQLAVQAKLSLGHVGDRYEQEADRMARQVVETVQRRELEEEELLQGKFASGLTGTLQEKPDASPNKTGIPDQLKSGLENLSGTAMDDVKVHYNSSKPAQFNALAYTQGQEIHVAPGQEKHLPHESWHAVQQKQGRVKPTGQYNGVAINDDAGLEREADVMGERAGEIGRLPSTTKQSPVQRQELEEEPMQGKMIETASSPKVMQKMAVMAVDDYKEQEDTLVWNNIDWAVRQAGGPIGDLTKHKVWDQLKNKKEIRFVEHGAVGTIGGKNAKDIANSMFNGKNKIPENIKIGRIVFQSCFAGVQGGKRSSLVSEMVKELANIGRKGVPVVGRTGIAFGFKGMGEETAKSGEEGKDAYFKAMTNLQNQKTKTTHVRIFKDPFVICGYQKPWDLIKIGRKAWDGMNEEDRMEKVANEMEPYWKKLKAEMKKLRGFKPSKEAIKTDIIKTDMKKSGFCFLTTACVEAKGLPDDCHELNTLRAFRDTYMRKLPDGPKMISEYYEKAPRIVARIKEQPNSQEILEGLYGRIVKSVTMIEAGQNEEALQNYIDLVLELNDKFL